MNYRRWLIVGCVLALMALTISVLLVPGQKYDTLTTSDSGWVYDLAVEIDRTNALAENNPLSHAPYGLRVSPSEQLQPLATVMLYRGLRAISGVELMDVVKFWAPFLFALSLIPIFLIGREFGGDVGGIAAAFFAATLVSSIYWNKVGAYDREPIQLILGAWAMYLTIKMFRAPKRSIPKFALLAGMVYGLFGLAWAGWSYMVAVLVFGVLLVFLVGFLGKFIRKTSDLLGAVSSAIRGHLDIVAGVVGMAVVVTIVLWVWGGQGPSFWVGIARTYLGYLGIGAGGGVSFPVYASEMQAPASWGDVLVRFYGDRLLTAVVFALVAIAFIKFCWSRKRWELLAFAWLIVLMAMVWPGKGQARFERLWWPFLPVLAGAGVATLVPLIQKFSLDPSGEWLKHLQSPIALLVVGAIVVSPFIVNAYNEASQTAPPTDWYYIGTDQGFMEAFAWLRENTPENSVVSIQWSYGHLLTGTARRATVCDGAETLGEIGKATGGTENTLVDSTKKWTPDIWKDAYVEIIEGTGAGQIRMITANTTTTLTVSPAWATIPDTTSRYLLRSNPVRPPDYIYYVEDSRGLIYGIMNVPRRSYWTNLQSWVRGDPNGKPGSFEINGRRVDVQWFPVIGENEFRWYLRTYRDNYGVKIDYVVFSYDEYYDALLYYNSVQPGEIIQSAENLFTPSQLTPIREDLDYVFNFGGDRKEVVFNSSTGNTYLRVDNEEFSLDGCGLLRIDGTYLGFYPPSKTPADIQETLVIILNESNNIVTAWLVKGVSEEIAERPVPMAMRVWENNIEDIGYLRVAFTSSNNMVKVLEISHAPYLISPVATKENDNTPEFRWDVIGANRYEFVLDNDPDFSSPLIYEDNMATTTYTIAEENALSDGDYYWKVTAYDSKNNCLGSDNSRFTVDTQAPGTPLLFEPHNRDEISTLGVVFRWTEPEQEVTYDIQIDNENGFATPLVHERTGIEENLYEYTFNNNGVYYWRVRAEDEAGNVGEWSDPFMLTVRAPPKAPSLKSPENGAFTNDNTPTLEWTGGNGDNYRLLISASSDLSSPTLEIILPPFATSYTIENLNALSDGKYYWKVVAVVGENENSSDVWNFVVDTVPPETPVLYAPENGAETDDKTPEFRWSLISDADRYHLIVDNDNTFDSPVINTWLEENTYVSTTPLSAGNYYWKVVAKDAAGNESESLIWTFRVVSSGG